MKKRTRWLLAAGLCLLALVGYLLIPASPPVFPIPDPNGYDDFVSAGDLARSGYPQVNLFLPNEPAVQAWVGNGSAVMASVKAGLSKPCRVPVRVQTNYLAINFRDRGSLRLLTHWMIARAEVAKVEGRTNDMFESYMDAFGFTYSTDRGGLDVDRMSKLGNEALIVRSLKSSIPVLSSEQCARALDLLRKLQADEESVSVLTQRTREWLKATFEAGVLRKAKLSAWRSRVQAAWLSRSLDPLWESPSRQLGKGQQTIESMRRDLRYALEYRAAKRE